MENYQMNCAGCRPYNRTCGMTKSMPRPDCVISGPGPVRPPHCVSKIEECNCKIPGIKSKNAEMYTHLAHLEPAMAYVPCQQFTTTFGLGHALQMGTIFPELCKPFCGKRGGRR